MPCRGIPAPVLKAALRPILTAYPLPDPRTWSDTILALWDAAEFGEERYAALAFARRLREQPPEALELYEHLVRSGAWWDLVGEVLSVHPEVGPVLEVWAQSDDLWLRRTAIICQVGAKDRLDRDLLTLAIDANLDGGTRTTPALSPHGREFFAPLGDRLGPARPRPRRPRPGARLRGRPGRCPVRPEQARGAAPPRWLRCEGRPGLSPGARAPQPAGWLQP
jgi:hypothetical protein